MIEKLTRPDTDWSRYRACPICKAPLGKACRSLSGRIVNGRPDGVLTILLIPHKARKLRIPRKRKGVM